MNRCSDCGSSKILVAIEWTTCAACPRNVNIACEGNDKDIGVLCPTHKNEVSYLKNQLQAKTNLEQQTRGENQDLSNSLRAKERETNELQAQIRMLELDLTEKEEGLSIQVNKLKKLISKIKS